MNNIDQIDPTDIYRISHPLAAYIFTMEYYSGIKKNKIMTFEVTCMDLEIVILHEISQTQKDKYHMI